MKITDWEYDSDKLREFLKKRKESVNHKIMEIKKENVIAAYQTGDDRVKDMLRTMFPDIEFEADTQADNRPITERVKTFEDACKELGESHPLVVQYKVIAENEDTEDVFGTGNDIIAYLKLRIVCAALNEGWEPQFTKDECRWYPLHFLITEDEIEEEDEEWKQRKALIDTGDYVTDYAGFAFDESIIFTISANTHIGSRLCLKRRALSDYYGTQFIRLWADFNLRRK